MKPIKGWVVVNPTAKRQDVVFTFSRSGEKLAIEAFLMLRKPTPTQVELLTWKDFYTIGYRCIRVTLRADE